MYNFDAHVINTMKELINTLEKRQPINFDFRLIDFTLFPGKLIPIYRMSYESSIIILYNLTNVYFWQRVPTLHINDLIEDLKDGTRLLALLEVLSGEKLVMKYL